MVKDQGNKISKQLVIGLMIFIGLLILALIFFLNPLKVFFSPPQGAPTITLKIAEGPELDDDTDLYRIVVEAVVFGNPDPMTEVETYMVTSEPHPDVGGTIVIREGTPIEAGTEVTVIATANQGFEFISWKDADLDWFDDVSTDAEYTFIVMSDRHLIAYFEPYFLPPWDYSLE